MADGTGRRMFNDDIAERLGIERRSVNWLFYQANRHRRMGTPRPGDLPPQDGRAMRTVDSGQPWPGRADSPWWWESTIEAWLAGRKAARREAWTRPHGSRGEFVPAAKAEAS